MSKKATKVSSSIIQKWTAKDRLGRTHTIRKHGASNYTFVGYSDYHGVRGTYGPYTSLGTCKSILKREGIPISKWKTTGKIKRRRGKK